MIKNFSYISIVIGILVVAIMSGMVYRSVGETNNLTTLKMKEFHANNIAESEIEKELSKNVNIIGLEEYEISAGGYNFAIVKNITQIEPNLKHVSVTVFYEHMSKSFSVQVFSHAQGW